MEFLSERLLRLAGLEGDESASTVLAEGLPEEVVSSHQPYQTEKTVESTFVTEEDDESELHEVGVEYAIKESLRKLQETRLRDTIRNELRSILAELDEADDEGQKYGASGFKRFKPSTKRKSTMGFAGPGFRARKS